MKAIVILVQHTNNGGLISVRLFSPYVNKVMYFNCGRVDYELLHGLMTQMEAINDLTTNNTKAFDFLAIGADSLELPRVVMFTS